MTISLAPFSWSRFCDRRMDRHTQGRRHGFKSGGTKSDSRAKRARKKILYPHIWKSGGTIFFTRGGTSKEVSIIIKYTEICCLVVALIHIYYSRPIMNRPGSRILSRGAYIGTYPFHIRGHTLEKR